MPVWRYSTLAASQLDVVVELTTARILIQLCDELLVSIDDLRSRVSARLKPWLHLDQTTWPF